MGQLRGLIVDDPTFGIPATCETPGGESQSRPRKPGKRAPRALLQSEIFGNSDETRLDSQADRMHDSIPMAP